MTRRKFDRFFILAVLLVFGVVIGCESKATGAAQARQSRDVSAAKSSKTDYSSIGSGLMKNDGIGPVRLGSSSDDVRKALGDPELKSQAGVSEVDGQRHQQWTYKKEGIVIDMVTEFGKQKVAMITVSAPSKLRTKRGVGIGSTRDAVKSAYAAEIDPSSSDPQTIVAGTVYGGLIFGLENGRVTSIVLGAVAE